MTTKAIIIKKENTNEYDQWVTCYTEEFGKLKTVAKSILKPNSIQALHLDILNLAEFDLVNGRGMPIVTGAQAIDSFLGIKNSFAKMSVAYFFAEVIDKLVLENDKDNRLWRLLISLLHELSREETNPVKTLRSYQIKMLDVLGYLPEVNLCRVCGDKMNINTFGAFNHVVGGVICKKCFLDGQSGILISSEDFSLLLNKPDMINWTNKRTVLDGIFEYISESKFYSLELLSVIK